MNTAKKYLSIFILIGLALFLTKAFADEAQGYFNKGHRFYLDSKPGQSEVEFKKALRLNPKLSDAHYYLGSIYFKQSRYQEAIAECRQAIALNPGDVKSLIILGVCFQQLELFDQATDAFGGAIAADNNSAAAHSGLGLVYCAQGELSLADEQYNILREIDAELAKDLLGQIQDLSSNAKELR